MSVRRKIIEAAINCARRVMLDGLPVCGQFVRDERTGRRYSIEVAELPENQTSKDGDGLKRRDSGV